MTSKQRAYLKGLAMTMDPSVNIGKESLTTNVEAAVNEAIEAHELVKVNVLKNCEDDPREIAFALSEDVKCDLVQVIGRKIVLYRQARKKEDRKIVLPR